MSNAITTTHQASAIKLGPTMRPVYLGHYSRFQAYIFHNVILGEPYVTLFVRDAEVMDEFDLPTVVYQSFLEKVASMAEVVDFLAQRYPESFGDEYAETVDLGEVAAVAI